MAWEHTVFTTRRADEAQLQNAGTCPLAAVPAEGKVADYFLYVLQLGDGRMLVGVTNDPHSRMNDEYSGEGTTFTEQYGVAGLVSVQELGEMSYAMAAERADMKTLELMCKYSYHWVRGGRWQMDADDDVLKALSAQRTAIEYHYRIRIATLIA